VPECGRLRLNARLILNVLWQGAATCLAVRNNSYLDAELRGLPWHRSRSVGRDHTSNSIASENYTSLRSDAGRKASVLTKQIAFEG